MHIFRKAFDFFVFSSVYIGICAGIMVWQVNDLFELSYNHLQFMIFVISSTICSYNFHWLLTTESSQYSARLSWTNRHRKLHTFLIAIFALPAIYSGLHFLAWWPWFGLAAFLTFLYSAPKIPSRMSRFLSKIAIGKTLFLTFVWTYVTTVLPIILGASGFHTEQLLFCLSRFFLIYAICILFDLRDKEADTTQGIRSLITYLSDANVLKLFYLTIAAFVVATVLLPLSGLMTAILLLPGFITAMLYRPNLQQQSDYYFYFILDGLMMLSGLIALVLKSF
jgi:1,4-dihydroxy-2-naphthoate octaprenyltransferase